jgi:predicted ArsR family transcriptional regulator
VSLPPRAYDLAADLLARAVHASSQTGTEIATAVRRVARQHGRTIGAAVRERAGGRASRRTLVGATLDALADHGYEPRPTRDGITLANCPFHRLATEHTDLVCGMNHALLGGLADAVGDGVLSARLDPAPDRCCVCIDTHQTSSRRS